MLDSGADPHPALDLAVDFDQQFPGISVILVSERGPEIGLEAMRAGIRDILDPASDVSDIRQMLDRAGDAAQARTVQPERRGRRDRTQPGGGRSGDQRRLPQRGRRARPPWPPTWPSGWRSPAATRPFWWTSISSSATWRQR